MNSQLITPLGQHAAPMISVMIPTYEPSQYLLETLESVLKQDMGSDRMQIAVIDDASRKTDVEALLAKAKLTERVTLVRNPVNLGLAGNWNRCIEHAQGALIHILHQDDLVLPGFYSTMCNAMLTRPDIGMAFCGCALIDGKGTVTEYARPQGRSANVIDNWITRITRRNLAHCASVIVRRDVYRQLGGYRSDLKYALDWEMWVRIGSTFPVWYDPRVLACYRHHTSNETTRLTGLEETYGDELLAMQIFANHLPEKNRAQLMSRAYSRIARSRLRKAGKLLRRNETSHASHMVKIADEAIGKLPPLLSRKLITLRSRLLKATIWIKAEIGPRS